MLLGLLGRVGLEHKTDADVFEVNAHKTLAFSGKRSQTHRVAPRSGEPLCASNRGVSIETREITYLSNSRTADLVWPPFCVLCGEAIGKPNFGFLRALIRDIEPSV